MDLKAFYQKIREVEETIEGGYALVVSLATPDGGKAGVPTEVSRAMAARMVVEQRARLATAEEKARYAEDQADRSRQTAEADLAKRMKIALLSDGELRQLRECLLGEKE